MLISCSKYDASAGFLSALMRTRCRVREAWASASRTSRFAIFSYRADPPAQQNRLVQLPQPLSVLIQIISLFRACPSWAFSFFNTMNFSAFFCIHLANFCLLWGSGFRVSREVLIVINLRAKDPQKMNNHFKCIGTGAIRASTPPHSPITKCLYRWLCDQGYEVIRANKSPTNYS